MSFSKSQRILESETGYLENIVGEPQNGNSVEMKTISEPANSGTASEGLKYWPVTHYGELPDLSEGGFYAESSTEEEERTTRKYSRRLIWLAALPVFITLGNWTWNSFVENTSNLYKFEYEPVAVETSIETEGYNPQSL